MYSDFRHFCRVFFAGWLAIFALWVFFQPTDLSAQDSIQVEFPNADTARVDSVSFDSVLTYYPKLYKDVLTREADSLWSWLGHDIPAVRRQAWRGMVHAEVSDRYQLELEVEESNHPAAWFALSHHDINKDLCRILEKRWTEGKRSRAGISRVLGKQCDQQSLQFLLNNLDRVKNSPAAFSTALAVGRLSKKYKVPNSEQFTLIRAAFTAGNVNSARAYLYGAYRSDSTIFNPEVRQNLYRLWQVYGIGSMPKLDQYLVNILGSDYPRIAMQPYLNVPVDSIDVQLGIELAKLTGNAPVDTVNVRMSRKLLHHPNPHVVQTALQSARDQKALGDSISTFLRDTLLHQTNLPDQLWSEILVSLSKQNTSDTDTVRYYVDRLDSLRRQNPYLLPNYLDIKRQLSPRAAYFSRIDTLLQSENSLKLIFAARELSDFWKSRPDTGISENVISRVRALMFKALETGDRGTVYVTAPLLGDPKLLKSHEFQVLKQTLTNFQLPADIEVYQSISKVMYDRFRDKSRALIDSLVALGHPPLNRSLKKMGWSVDPPKTSTDSVDNFRMADWSRLAELGPHPIWTLRLRKDTIRIRLDPLRAPLTVSAIDSLTRAGVYDSVAFHRVVPNFVIQGGDIERGDGFGGPSFTVPTEPSEKHYYRGSVGIASAGTDTEGSQYFIMHQWKPHLNGNYTRMGEVVEGMEAVDRVMVGDRVLEAWIIKAQRWKEGKVKGEKR